LQFSALEVISTLCAL